MRGKGHSGRWQLLGTQSSRESKILKVYERKKSVYENTQNMFVMLVRETHVWPHEHDDPPLDTD